MPHVGSRLARFSESQGFKMARPLTLDQRSLLTNAATQALIAPTLRALSDLRWLEHLGLLVIDDDGRFAITAEGIARLATEQVPDASNS